MSNSSKNWTLRPSMLSSLIPGHSWPFFEKNSINAHVCATKYAAFEPGRRPWRFDAGNEEHGDPDGDVIVVP